MQLFFKLLWAQILNYIRTNLAEKLLKACLKGLESFKKTVWEELREDIHEQALAAISHVEVYFGSEDCKVKENMVVDTIMERIKLPLLLKPFRGLIKRMLKDKIIALRDEMLNKIKEAMS